MVGGQLQPQGVLVASVSRGPKHCHLCGQCKHRQAVISTTDQRLQEAEALVGHLEDYINELEDYIEAMGGLTVVMVPPNVAGRN